MKAVKTSEFKAHLARFLRLVRNGEVVEILDRGIPIARVTGTLPKTEVSIRPPIKPPGELATLKSSVRKAPKEDVLELLLEDRRNR